MSTSTNPITPKIETHEEINYEFKILLLGDSAVGKTSLLLKYTDKTFLHNQIPTIGVDYRLKCFSIDDIKIKLTIWDTAGQERFRNIISNYYNNADAVLLVFDLTNLESFEKILYWYSQIEKNKTISKVVICLCGNKSDLENNIKVSPQEIEKIKKDYNVNYFQASAKTGKNVVSCFAFLIEELLKVNGCKITEKISSTLIAEEKEENYEEQKKKDLIEN
ncbi:MAG: GTP-binding protein, partial [archaeon]|nr:GTP-binding protein [archaeon]